MSTTCFMVDQFDDWFTPGAMFWRRHTYEEYDRERRPMPHLAVMTPAGIACLDCPATDEPHGYWTRTGVPPLVTVTPSLNINNDEWHGFLTDGVLTP